jgi:hypothetical protein
MQDEYDEDPEDDESDLFGWNSWHLPRLRYLTRPSYLGRPIHIRYNSDSLSCKYQVFSL